MSQPDSQSGFMFGEKQHEFSFTEADFKRISSLMYQRVGVCLPPKKAEMVYCRLSRRLRALGLQTFSEYLDIVVKGDGEEWSACVGVLTTHLTSFFREEHHFPVLAEHAEKKSAYGRVKLWSSASSTGEEPYSMAICMAEQFGTLYPPVDIVATDVDPGVVKKAQAGIYHAELVESLSDHIVKRYFLRGGGANSGFVKIRPELQQMITFMPLNLLAPVWPFAAPFDAVFCRNVMIYFDRPTQKQVLRHCQRHLAADGLFFAGHSENLGHVPELFYPSGKTVYRPFVPQAAFSSESLSGEACYA